MRRTCSSRTSIVMSGSTAAIRTGCLPRSTRPCLVRITVARMGTGRMPLTKVVPKLFERQAAFDNAAITWYPAPPVWPGFQRSLDENVRVAAKLKYPLPSEVILIENRPRTRRCVDDSTKECCGGHGHTRHH